MLSPEVARRLHSSGVDAACRGKEKPSDHAPVWITVDAPVAVAA